MMTKNEAEDIGFVAAGDFRFPDAFSFQADDFSLWMDDGKLKLNEWEREEGIDVSHLTKEQVGLLISLLKKSK